MGRPQTGRVGAATCCPAGSSQACATDDAVAIERDRSNAEHGYHEDHEDEEEPTTQETAEPASLAELPPGPPVDESLPLAQRRPRRAKTTKPPSLQLLVAYLKSALVRDIDDMRLVLEDTQPVPKEMGVFGQEGIVVSQ